MATSAQGNEEVRQWVTGVFSAVRVTKLPPTLIGRYAEDLVSKRISAKLVQEEALAMATAVGAWPPPKAAGSAPKAASTASTAAVPAVGATTASATWSAGTAPPRPHASEHGPSLISFTDEPPPLPSFEQEKARLRSQIGFSSEGTPSSKGSKANNSGLNKEEVEAYVTTLYAKAVGRKPDPATFNYIVGNLLSGEYTLNQAELMVVNGKEAREYRAKQQKDNAAKAAKFRKDLEEFVKILFKKYAKDDSPSAEEVEEHVQSLLDGSATFDSKEAEFKLLAL